MMTTQKKQIGMGSPAPVEPAMKVLVPVHGEKLEKTPKRVQKWQRFRAKFVPRSCVEFCIGYIGGQPKSCDIIRDWYREHKSSEDSAFQTALLELLALKMPPNKRRMLIGQQGKSINDDKGNRHSELHSLLHRQDPEEIGNFGALTHYHVALRERWYGESKQGRLDTLNEIFDVLSDNPHGLCNLLAES